MPFQRELDKCYMQVALSHAELSKAQRKKVGAFGFFDLDNCCKLKTDYYIGKKKLMRMTSKGAHELYNFSRSVENKLPEQWKFAVEQIKKDFTVQDEWATMQGLARRTYLEKIYKENYLE